MKIVVFGAGGVGGYFGGRWASAGLDVTLVARGAHLSAIQASGLGIRSALGDETVKLRAVDSADAASEADLVLVSTKTWQLPEAAQAIGAAVGPGTVVLGVQNGVDSAEVLAREVGAARVLAGTCRLIAYVETPGVIRHVGGHPTLTFGEVGGGLSHRAELLRDTLARGRGMTVSASEDVDAELWKKLHFFAPVAGVGSITRSPMGVLRGVPQTRAMLWSAMEEVLALALARGVSLPRNSTELAMSFVDGLPPEGTSSMQRDFRDGKRTELDALSGAVVRLAAQAGVPTPVHEFIVAALLPQELVARGELKAPASPG